MSSAPLANSSLPEYTLIGTPFSTFTRTIAIALVKKGVPFKQVKTLAQPNVEPLFMIEGPYSFGSRMTWADAFLYHLIADLMTVPESMFISTRLLKWAKVMELGKGAQQAFPGTLATRGRP